MITITTKHPKRRAEILFRNHLIPIASTLYPENPQDLQKTIFGQLNQYVIKISKPIIHLSLSAIWEGYTQLLTSKAVRDRFSKIYTDNKHVLYLFFCDELFEAIHEDLQKREISGEVYKDPILVLWESLTREQQDILRENEHARINSFEKFREKVLLDLRELTHHESECRRIGFVWESQRQRTG